jgi:3-oxo-5-alpha-steroid 4-dehydrogenase 1
MSPIHILIWLAGLAFQLFNAISIGGWLAGYGPTTREEWSNHSTNYLASARMEAGLMIWALGFLLTIFHDDELREIRRAVVRREKKVKEAAEAEKEKNANANANANGKGKAGTGNATEKVYLIPKNGFFRWILYPHYLFEWMEWSGFWLMGGPKFTPGRTFVINEISTMLPRALQGKRWYQEKFGKEKLDGRTALIPGLL